jgi:hypothetical protein
METVDKIKFTEKGLYSDRSLLVKQKDEKFSFFELDNKTDEEFELSNSLIKWLVENDKIEMTDVSPYIKLNIKRPTNSNGETTEKTYVGRSSKIKSEKVYIISKTGNKVKIQDELGNEATVSEKTLR